MTESIDYIGTARSMLSVLGLCNVALTLIPLPRIGGFKSLRVIPNYEDEGFGSSKPALDACTSNCPILKHIGDLITYGLWDHRPLATREQAV